MTPLDPTSSLLHVSETVWGETAPHAACLCLQLAADRLFSGSAAFENAKELRRLVVGLSAHGVPEDATSLHGATLDISEGLFTRSSSVTYRVQIRLVDLDLLPGAIDAITECKEARLTSIDWDYRGGSAATALVTECAQRAHTKARALAAALGAEIECLHSVHTDEHEDAPPIRVASYERASAVPVARKKSVAGELAGLDLAPTKKIGVSVRLACRISRSKS